MLQTYKSLLVLKNPIAIKLQTKNMPSTVASLPICSLLVLTYLTMTRMVMQNHLLGCTTQKYQPANYTYVMRQLPGYITHLHTHLTIYVPVSRLVLYVTSSSHLLISLSVYLAAASGSLYFVNNFTSVPITYLLLPSPTNSI